MNTNLQSAIEKSSLRQVALVVGVNYNMMLHASHQPIKGVAYDPEFLNIDEIEKLVIKKIGEEELAAFDWARCKDKVVHINADFMNAFEVGTEFTLRNGEHCKVNYMNPEYIVFTAINGTKPQVMSYATFEHQGPKAH